MVAEHAVYLFPALLWCGRGNIIAATGVALLNMVERYVAKGLDRRRLGATVRVVEADDEQ